MMTDRNRLIELLKQAQDNYCDICAEDLGYKDHEPFENYFADYLLANGVIVPPCKVGDTVWVNYEYYKREPRTYPVKVYAYRFDTKKNNMRICVEGNFKISAYGGNYTHYYNGTFAWNSVGKTVFLTKEEAEKALKEQRKEDEGE